MKQLAFPPDLLQQIGSIKDHRVAPLLPSRSSPHTPLHNKHVSKGPAVCRTNRYSPGPFPERPIRVNPGFTFCFVFVILHSYALLRVTFCVIITVSRS